jgi:hypothetical protein
MHVACFVKPVVGSVVLMLLYALADRQTGQTGLCLQLDCNCVCLHLLSARVLMTARQSYPPWYGAHSDHATQWQLGIPTTNLQMQAYIQV